MSEDIEQIAKAIKKHRDLEIKISAQNRAFARFCALYDKTPIQLWLTNEFNLGSFQWVKDITGAVVGTQSGKQTTVTENGYPICKNTKLGELLIKNFEGKHPYQTPKGLKVIEIVNRALYKPDSKELAVELSIQLAGTRKPYGYRSLLDMLQKIKKLKDDLENLNRQKAKTEKEDIAALLSKIQQKTIEQENAIKKAQSFVRKNAELRYQPILDSFQETIKRSHIFDGTIAIDGGPGTGKTTALIQRIKFLISDTIIEYVELSNAKKDKLFDKKRSWIFFSPSELLKLYLKESMISEGLEATTDKVKVWEDYKGDMIKAYKIVDTNKRAFLVDNSSANKELIISNGAIVKHFVDSFINYYLEHKKNSIIEILKLELTPFIWKNLGKSIQSYLDRFNISDFDFDTLIYLFLNLNNNYFKEAKALSDEYNKTIDEFAAKYVIEIKKDNQTAKNIENLLTEWKSDELEPNDDNLEVENYQDAGFDKALLFRLKFLIRKSALSKYDKSIGLTSKDNQLMGLIPKIKERDMPIHDRIGQLAYFKKYLEGILKGISDNIFADIPILYKEFRLTALDKDFGYEPKLLGELVKRNENKRLHKNEQAFLLYFINTLVKKVSKISPPTYAESNHPYFKSFKENSRPVIGVDEATDFHVMDLIAIHSFGDLDISSITYSGDLMQRMTSFGLKNWTELSLLVDNFHVKELTISYRQSFTLLNVAKAVYENATQKVANYTSYLEEDISEPKPLLFQYDDKKCAIDWIAARVHEIYRAYGDAIPSIAIFLPSENELESFAKELGEMDELADVGIKVKACRNGEVLGDTNTIRVFSRQFIKGLEFEAVFFHNVDKLEDNIEHQENLLKHLYVGLSRATLYLAVTVMQEFKNELGFLNQLFEKKILSWKLK